MSGAAGSAQRPIEMACEEREGLHLSASMKETRHQLLLSAERSIVAVDRLGRKRRNANGKTLGSVRTRRAVANPLAANGHHCVAGLHVQHLLSRFHPQHLTQDHGIFVEFRCLSRLLPSCELCIRAMLTAEEPESTRPINSSMSFGLFPATCTLVGHSIKSRHRVSSHMSTSNLNTFFSTF